MIREKEREKLAAQKDQKSKWAMARRAQIDLRGHRRGGEGGDRDRETERGLGGNTDLT